MSSFLSPGWPDTGFPKAATLTGGTEGAGAGAETLSVPFRAMSAGVMRAAVFTGAPGLMVGAVTTVQGLLVRAWQIAGPNDWDGICSNCMQASRMGRSHCHSLLHA